MFKHELKHLVYIVESCHLIKENGEDDKWTTRTKATRFLYLQHTDYHNQGEEWKTEKFAEDSLLRNPDFDDPTTQISNYQKSTQTRFEQFHYSGSMMRQVKRLKTDKNNQHIVDLNPINTIDFNTHQYFCVYEFDSVKDPQSGTSNGHYTFYAKQGDGTWIKENDSIPTVIHLDSNLKDQISRNVVLYF